MKTKTTLPKYLTLFLVLHWAVECHSQQGAQNEVKTAGTMEQVMMMGELQGRIELDSMKDKKHLYGLGPLEFLKGEIMIWDGTAYYSKVGNKDQIVVQTGFNVKAPFFVYANIARWKELTLPNSIENQHDLEDQLDKTSPTDGKPFAFKISTTIDSAKIHVVDLPDGTNVSSPEDARLGQRDYIVTHQPVDIVGFFSRKHQGVFTHHSSYIHMHLITVDRKSMGHVDSVIFGSDHVVSTIYVSE